MKQAFLKIHHWFFQPYPLSPLILSRICFGLVMFLMYLSYLPDLGWLTAKDGLLDYVMSGETGAIRHPWPIYFLLLASAITFSIGFFTRFSGLMLLACHLSFISNNYHFPSGWGWGRKIPLFLGCLILANVGKCYSLDALLARKRRKTPNESNTIPAWPARFIQLQIATVYFSAAWARIFDPEWIKGEIMFATFTAAYVSRFPHLDWMAWKGLLSLGTWGGWLLELLAPVALWIPRLCTWWAVGLIFLSVMLEITTTTEWWHFGLISVLVVFLPPSFSGSVLDRLAALGSWCLDTALHKKNRAVMAK